MLSKLCCPKWYCAKDPEGAEVINGGDCSPQLVANRASSWLGEVTPSDPGLGESKRPAGAGVLGEIAPGEVKSPGLAFTTASAGLLVGVGNEVGLTVLMEKESVNPMTAPPWPLDWEFGESTDMRFVLPPQFNRTL